MCWIFLRVLTVENHFYTDLIGCTRGIVMFLLENRSPLKMQHQDLLIQNPQIDKITTATLHSHSIPQRAER